jgi:Acyl-CoA synthetases (AMP-forming)/AMP-acid ligases II
MYHTGDLARWMPDGNIEYLGRIDDQVKIRGFRIELGEIEAVIRKIDYIKDCAVVVRKDSDGEPNICAYVVSDRETDTEEIKRIIGKDLTDYMIPAFIMQIEKIPVTLNGKLDRRALPEIVVKSKKEYRAPENETEEKICKAFEENTWSRKSRSD